MPHEALMDELAAGLAPVRPRSVAREALLLLVLGAAELALLLAVGLMRPDFGRAIETPFMWWKLGSLALVVAISWTTAIRSLSPTVSPRPGLALAFTATALAIASGALVDAGVVGQASITERLEPLHGLGCALAIIILSLPMIAIMAILMHRGAPTHPEGTALAIGLAAGSWAAFAFAFCCPNNDPLYVAIWYSLGCAAVAAAAQWLLPRSYRL
jgi:hypothetical protein